MRLAQAFGPGMASRTADGVNSAVAFVNILSVHALSADPQYGAFSASAGGRTVDQPDAEGRVPCFGSAG
jgi:short-subunit dehydrogenase